MLVAAHSLIFDDPKEFLNGRTLASIRELGYRGIELIPINWSKRECDKLKLLAQNEALTVLLGWSFGPEEDPINEDRAVRKRALDRVKRLVEIAQILESPRIAGLNYAGVGCLPGRPCTQNEWIRAVDAFRGFCEYVSQNGEPYLCLEPAVREDSHIIGTAQRAVAFIKAVGHPLARILLDTHQMLREEDDIQTAIQEAGNLIGYVHVSESHRGIPGRGLVPWHEVFTALNAQGYRDWFGVEAFWSTASPVAGRAKVWRDMAPNPFMLLEEAISLIQSHYHPTDA